MFFVLTSLEKEIENLNDDEDKQKQKIVMALKTKMAGSLAFSLIRICYVIIN